MKIVKVKSESRRVKIAKKLIESAGNQMGSCWFRKRSDGSKRRMSFRLHVQKPSYASKPTGKHFQETKAKDSDNHQMTVLDVNKVRYNNKGRICGRADWRTIPLETVERVAVRGEIYRIVS